MIRVYISSTFKDLREHRQSVAKILEQLGHTTHAMEKYYASDERPLSTCLADLAKCDLYVGIFGWRYGFVPAGSAHPGASITECEFREALRLGKPILAFLSADGPDRWPECDHSNLAKTQRLREDAGSIGSHATFASADNLASLVSVAVAQWLRKPSLRVYLSAVVDETSELKPFPNRVKNLHADSVVTPTVDIDNAQSDSKHTPTALIDLVRTERKLFLVGDAGHGKSTALHYLARRFAEESLANSTTANGDDNAVIVPIRVDLRVSGADLCKSCWEAMQRDGFNCSPELFDAWLATLRFVFLIDTLDETDQPRAIQQCENLLQRAPASRFVVASRPLAALERTSWTRARLSPFTPKELQTFLSRLTDPKTGAELTRELERNQLTEVFQRPLFARLLVLASEKSTTKSRASLTRVFDDVVTHGFLAGWADHDRSPIRQKTVRAFLASCAVGMLEAKKFTLSEGDAAERGMALLRVHRFEANLETVETLLSVVVTHGLMHRTESGLGFWHSALRDYFAAIWFAEQAPSFAAFRRLYRGGMEDCLVFYFGLAIGPRARRLLRRTARCVGFDLWLLKRVPSPAAAQHLVLVLRCLAECAEGQDIAAAVIRRLPLRPLELDLSHAGAPASWLINFKYGPAGTRYFLYLVSRLRHDEGKEYLRRVVCPLDMLVPAVLADADDSMVRRLVAAIAGNPAGERLSKRGPQAITKFLLESNDPRYRREMNRVLGVPDEPGRRALLFELANFLQFNPHQVDVGGLADLLEETLALVALEESDSAPAAARLLLAVGRPSMTGTPKARKLLMTTLRDGSGAARKQAMQVVRHEKFDDYEDVRWGLLRDPDLDMVFGALRNYALYDQESLRFCHAVLVVLRHHVRNADVLQIATSLAPVLAERADCRYPRCVGFLMATARYAEINGFRHYALWALSSSACLQPWMGDWFTDVWRREPYVEARRVALSNAVDALGERAGPVLFEALLDPETEVRGYAAYLLHRFPNWPDKAIEIKARLWKLLSDPEEYVRRYAILALKDRGFLTDDWAEGIHPIPELIDSSGDPRPKPGVNQP